MSAFHPLQGYPLLVYGQAPVPHPYGNNLRSDSYFAVPYGYVNGQMTVVPNDLALAVVPFSAQQASVVPQDQYLPPGTRVVTHVPLDIGDQPGAPNSKKIRLFRNMVNWANELDRLIPDLDTANQQGWQEHITTLNRKINHLERNLRQCARKHAQSPVFKELLPNYPQLWKYLDVSSPRRLEQGDPSRAAPRVSRRQLEAPPSPTKTEDSKDHVLESLANMRISAASGSNHSPRRFQSLKQEDEHDPARLDARLVARQAQQVAVRSNVTHDDIKLEKHDNSDDDYVITCERNVVRRLHLNHIPTRTTQPDVQSRSAHNQEKTRIKHSVHTRSLRSRDIVLPRNQQRSRSPTLRSQFYRDRFSPRRDAVVEELSDSE